MNLKRWVEVANKAGGHHGDGKLYGPEVYAVFPCPSIFFLMQHSTILHNSGSFLMTERKMTLKGPGRHVT